MAFFQRTLIVVKNGKKWEKMAVSAYALGLGEEEEAEEPLLAEDPPEGAEEDEEGLRRK